LFIVAAVVVVVVVVIVVVVVVCQVSIDPQCMQEMVVTCLSLVDNFRCLVGDSNGQLHMLFLETEENMDADTTRVAALEPSSSSSSSSMVTSLRLELLGEVRKRDRRRVGDRGRLREGNVVKEGRGEEELGGWNGGS